MEPKGRTKIQSIIAPNPQQSLVRLLNSTPDFAAAVDFVSRARRCRQSTIKHAALLLGALLSYSRPFKDHDGCALSQIPVFGALATDLGADLQLHVRIVRLSMQALASSQRLYMQAAGNHSSCKLQSYWLADRLGPTLAGQLDLEAFERIANLMRVACVLTLAEIGDPHRRHRTVNLQ